MAESKYLNCIHSLLLHRQRAESKVSSELVEGLRSDLSQMLHFLFPFDILFIPPDELREGREGRNMPL